MTLIILLKRPKKKRYNKKIARNFPILITDSLLAITEEKTRNFTATNLNVENYRSII